MSRFLGQPTHFVHWSHEAQSYVPTVYGRVYFYEAATTIPSVTFSDPERQIPNTNPVLLDEQGSAPIYLQHGLRYHMIVYRQDRVIASEIDELISQF